MERGRNEDIRPGCSAAFSVPGEDGGELLVITAELREAQVSSPLSLTRAVDVLLHIQNLSCNSPNLLRILPVSQTGWRVNGFCGVTAVLIYPKHSVHRVRWKQGKDSLGWVPTDSGEVVPSEEESSGLLDTARYNISVDERKNTAL